MTVQIANTTGLSNSNGKSSSRNDQQDDAWAAQHVADVITTIFVRRAVTMKSAYH